MSNRFLVAIPEGTHPIPSRTRSLRPPGPMVLHGTPCGRVGRCQDFFSKPVEVILDGLFLCRFSGFVSSFQLPASSFQWPRRRLALLRPTDILWPAAQTARRSDRLYAPALRAYLARAALRLR